MTLHLRVSKKYYSHDRFPASYKALGVVLASFRRLTYLFDNVHACEVSASFSIQHSPPNFLHPKQKPTVHAHTLHTRYYKITLTLEYGPQRINVERMFKMFE
jgi:hypothetical protein